MYFPADLMEKIVKSCGYDGYYKLYVSCDYDCNKRSGGLYRTIAHEMGDEIKIAHVGDNYPVDVKSAKHNGLSAYYYKNCHDIGNPYRADGMSELIGSFYAGIVNTHLHNGVEQYNPYYEYGYIYGGLYVTGYCNWMHKKVKEEGVDKILFLSRDGSIYQRAFNTMYSDVPNEYVYWSRIANIKYAIDKQRGDFFVRLVIHGSVAVIPRTYRDVLSSISLQCLIPLLKNYGIDENGILTVEKRKIFEDFLLDNWAIIEETYEAEALQLKKIMEEILVDCKTVAVVDVGWAGAKAAWNKIFSRRKMES